MAYERTPITLSPEEMESIKTNLTALDTNISKYAVNLKLIERKRTYKVGTRALPFIELSLKYAQEYPQYGSTFFNLEKFNQDFTFYTQVKGMVENIAPLLEKLTDSYMAVGADAYAAARSYYDSVKLAAKANKHGAEAIVTELSNAYKRKRGSTTSNETTELKKKPRAEASSIPSEAAA